MDRTGLRATLCATALFAACALAAPNARASGRQLHGGPLAGGALLAHSDLTVGGVVAGQLAYGLTDQFRLYGALEVPLGVSVQRGSPWIGPGLAVGVAFSFDALTWVPWVGLEARVHGSFGTMSTLPVLVGGGVRLGVDWLPSRYFGLTIQGSYALCWLDPSPQSLTHFVTLVAGPRWTVDL